VVTSGVTRVDSTPGGVFRNVKRVGLAIVPSSMFCLLVTEKVLAAPPLVIEKLVTEKLVTEKLAAPQLDETVSLDTSGSDCEFVGFLMEESSIVSPGTSPAESRRAPLRKSVPRTEKRPREVDYLPEAQRSAPQPVPPPVGIVLPTQQQAVVVISSDEEVGEEAW
jgi:hypothetical protein